MSYKERTAEWWRRVNKDECAYEIYGEKHGIHECRESARHTHHIIPEGTLLLRGEDSEHAIGLPLCERHHVRNTGDEEYSKDFSFHPDAGEAYKQYHEWKQQQLHMESITGKRNKKVPRQSPFEDMVDEHHRKQKLGERYHAGTDELDQHYIDKMRNKGVIYQAEHPEDRKPETSPNPRFDPKKKKHWYDGLFD